MKLHASKYNELNINEVAKYIKSEKQIIRPQIRNGVLIAHINCEDAKNVYVYSDDEVVINNVRFPLAAAKDKYFSHEISIVSPCVEQ